MNCYLQQPFSSNNLPFLVLLQHTRKAHGILAIPCLRTYHSEISERRPVPLEIPVEHHRVKKENEVSHDFFFGPPPAFMAMKEKETVRAQRMHP